MEIVRIDLSGAPTRAVTEGGNSPAAALGLLGVDVSPADVAGVPHVSVQVLFDDDRPGFDRSLLDGPMVAELLGGHGQVLARDPFDHDRFRQRLLAEREAGEAGARGVLVLTDGELPPPWIRLAFLPIALKSTAGATLVVRRTTVVELMAGIDEAHAHGDVTDAERDALLTTIEQLHPDEP